MLQEALKVNREIGAKGDAALDGFMLVGQASSFPFVRMA